MIDPLMKIQTHTVSSVSHAVSRYGEVSVIVSTQQEPHTLAIPRIGADVTEQLQLLYLFPGDTINLYYDSVYKANRITQVLTAQQSPSISELYTQTKCHHCHSPLILGEYGITCPHHRCPMRLASRMQHFCGHEYGLGLHIDIDTCYEFTTTHKHWFHNLSEILEPTFLSRQMTLPNTLIWDLKTLLPMIRAVITTPSSPNRLHQSATRFIRSLSIPGLTGTIVDALVETAIASGESPLHFVVGVLEQPEILRIMFDLSRSHEQYLNYEMPYFADELSSMIGHLDPMNVFDRY